MNMNYTNSFLGLVAFVLAIIALVDILKGPMNTNKKLLWVFIVLLLPVIGMILYFILEKKILDKI